ncbi:MAG: hypothetical protein AAFY11_10535 [Cyanobacteria bacterium J06641_5]
MRASGCTRLMKWDIEQANRYIEGLTNAFAALAKAPMQAMACDDIRPSYR